MSEPRNTSPGRVVAIAEHIETLGCYTQAMTLRAVAERLEKLQLDLEAEVRHRQRWAPAITGALKAAGIETDTGDIEECVRGIERLQASKLHKACSEFIRENHIYAPETVYQADRVSLNSLELVEKICDIVGYHKAEAE